MERRKKNFYGTPLNKVLQDNDDDEFDSRLGTSRTRRKERLDKQQTVRDDQGRQRFHGAFTGGFSAGYFNTVDSIAGFKPKEFISHRKDKLASAGHYDKQSGFSHKPEDYMDEEDLGEFGIAPKRVRLKNQYQSDREALFAGSSTSSKSGTLDNIIRCQKQTIGEKILEKINLEFRNRRLNSVDNFKAPQFKVKNDFHGLGYKPLRARESLDRATNPLKASVGPGGQKITISGEAFGTGVLDDGDEYFLGENDTYGYDDMSNYTFDPKDRTKQPRIEQAAFKKRKNYAGDVENLPGFVIAKKDDCSNNINNPLKKYPIPVVPRDWVEPRKEDQVKSKPETKLVQLTFSARPTTSNEILRKKFTNAADLLKSHDIESKAGLVSYSDLSKVTTSRKQSKSPVEEPKEVAEATISREKFEWRPCSLLCKHFNVPNPFPDNLFCGVKELQTKKVEPELARASIQPEKPQSVKPQRKAPASMELKRSIYDINIQDEIVREGPPITIRDLEDVDDDEELPQVVEIIETDRLSESSDDRTTRSINFETSRRPINIEESEIEELPVTKQKPELICLSSDSDDSNSYGPPLPPTLKTLIDAHQQLQSKTIQKPRMHDKKPSSK